MISKTIVPWEVFDARKPRTDPSSYSMYGLTPTRGTHVCEVQPGHHEGIGSLHMAGRRYAEWIGEALTPHGVHPTPSPRRQCVPTLVCCVDTHDARADHRRIAGDRRGGRAHLCAPPRGGVHHRALGARTLRAEGRARALAGAGGAGRAPRRACRAGAGGRGVSWRCRRPRRSGRPGRAHQQRPPCTRSAAAGAPDGRAVPGVHARRCLLCAASRCWRFGGAIATLSPNVRLGRLECSRCTRIHLSSSPSMATLAHASARARQLPVAAAHRGTAATQRIEEMGWIPVRTPEAGPGGLAAVHALATSRRHKARRLYDDEVLPMPPTRAPLDAFSHERVSPPGAPSPRAAEEGAPGA